MASREKVLIAVTILALVIAVASLTEAFVMTVQLNAQLNAQSKRADTLASKVDAVSSKLDSVSKQFTNPPRTREIRVEWVLAYAEQDRFLPSLIVVNQGDTVDLTFINNDTVAHNFLMGPPYSIHVNASVPGLVNDLTGETITIPATHNSPGVKVSGSPGSVAATYSFVAKSAGIFQFVCSYHIQVGMIGYLVVLPNFQGMASTVSLSAAGSGLPRLDATQSGQSPTTVPVSIDSGSGINMKLLGYTPANITVVIGVNNTVQWTNNDNMPHDVSALDGSFDSGNLNRGKSFVYTFTKAGTYVYTCTYHPWMGGTVTVLPATSNSSQSSTDNPSQSYGGFKLTVETFQLKARELLSLGEPIRTSVGKILNALPAILFWQIAIVLGLAAVIRRGE